MNTSCTTSQAQRRQQFLASLHQHLRDRKQAENYENAGKWITIGGTADGEKKHVGGTHVELDDSGQIKTGPESLVGKHIGQVDQNKPKEKPAIEFPERGLKLQARPENKPVPKASQGSLFDTSPKPQSPRGPGQATADQLHVDPSRFQYKISGIDPKTGVAKHLDDAKFNPLFAGQLLVWHDPQDGKSYVINGHHRHHLAQRSGYAGPMSVYHIDANSAQEARAIGALANIAGGNGTAVDAAKFMRDSGTSLQDLAKHGVSVSGAIARDAEPLSNLHPELFQGLTMGRIDTNRALAFSRHLKDQNLQKQLSGIVAKREAKTKKTLSNGTIEEMSREMAAAGTRKEKQRDIFGEYEDEKSNFVEKNEIKAFIRRSLTEDKNAFRAVSKKKRNARLEEAGNVLDTEANAQHADTAARAVAGFDKLVDLKGPLAELLNAAAAKYGSNPRQRATIFNQSFSEALEHIRAELGQPTTGDKSMGTPETRSPGQEQVTYARSGSTTAGGYTQSHLVTAFSAAFSAAMGGSNETYAASWEESKHPRDHGKFSSKPGAKGTAEKPHSHPGSPVGKAVSDLKSKAAPPPTKPGIGTAPIKPDRMPYPHDMTTALARGDDATQHIAKFAQEAKTQGLSSDQAYKHAQQALAHHYPPANADGHDTQTLHKQSDGNYTPQRKLLHQNIVSGFMHGVKTGQDKPEVHFMGGGPASGKSSVIRSGQVMLPDSHVSIDPDAIKHQMPDFKIGTALKHGPVASHAHEESSDVANMLRDTAAAEKAHVVVDGTGDSGYAKMAAKVEAMKAKGYKAVANYVTVGTDEAVRRAQARAADPKSDSYGRMVPEDVIRGTHKAVSQIVPQAIQNGLFDEMTVYDTEVPMGQPPIKIASAMGNQLTVHHPERWQKFLAKGQ